MKELQALGLDFKVLSKDMEEIDLRETFADDDDLYNDQYKKDMGGDVAVDSEIEAGFSLEDENGDPFVDDAADEDFDD